MVRTVKLHRPWRLGWSLLVGTATAIIAVGCNVAEGPSSVNTSSSLDKKTEAQRTSQSSKEKQASKSTFHQDIETHIPKAVDIGLDLPFFKGDISALAAELGDGPYKIGTPVNGFMSKHIKEAFAFYDKKTLFSEYLNTDTDICNFAKLALFSQEIDLSQFYWPHPDGGAVLPRNRGRLTHLFKDNSGFAIHFKYHDYRVEKELNGRAIHRSFNNPILHICNQNGICRSEYDLDNESIFPESHPGSTIGFFFHQDELYITSLRFFEYSPFINRNGFHGVAHIGVKVTKVSYKDIPKTFSLTPVCEYRKFKDSN